MADIEFVVRLDQETLQDLYDSRYVSPHIKEVFRSATPLPEGHGRLGDLDELEQRISNFVEHDAHITDEYTVARQRFIVDGIRQTTAIIEADIKDKELEEEEREV